MDYLIRFVQAHESFRQTELEALSKLANVEVETIFYSETSPFCIVRFKTKQNRDEIASRFISRSILSRGIYELWGIGANYEELHADVKKRSSHLWKAYLNVSFKFSVDAYCGKRTIAQQREIINSFRYLGFEGKIDLAKPDVEFTAFEEWSVPCPPVHHVGEEALSNVDIEPAARRPKRLFCGRYIASSRRHLIEKHDLKKRPYISTTSMDAELALVTANSALARPGKLFFDPFVGTGGFMVAAAELGAVVLGSDIDGRSFRGKGRGLEKGVGANFKKYGLQNMFGDCVISDLTNSPFRSPRHGTESPVSNSIRRSGVIKGMMSGRWLDGIVCDPPYGVREGLKVLGRRNDVNDPDAASAPFLIDGVPAYTIEGYVAPKKPYSFVRMLDDILDFGARTLVDEGRLAFWMPTVNEEDDIKIPQHRCFELIHCCVQPFNKWSRRLLIYSRKSSQGWDGSEEDQSENIANGTSADELNPFRRKYFRGFE